MGHVRTRRWARWSAPVGRRVASKPMLLSRVAVSRPDPLALNRALDDKAYSLDHIPTKVAKPPGMMQTDAGRRLGEERLALLDAFQTTFAAEWTGSKNARA